MTYRAAMFGAESHIVCDGCGRKHAVAGARGPFAWFFRGKAPKGWLVQRSGDLRRDWCRECFDAGSHVP